METPPHPLGSREGAQTSCNFLLFVICNRRIKINVIFLINQNLTVSRMNFCTKANILITVFEDKDMSPCNKI